MKKTKSTFSLDKYGLAASVDSPRKSLWLSILVLAFFLGFDWMMLVGLDILDEYDNVWRSGIAWISIALVLFVIGICFPAITKRAYVWHWFYGLLVATIGLGNLDVAYRFIQHASEKPTILPPVLMFGACAVFVVARTRESQLETQRGRHYAVQAGMFDPEAAEWDIRAAWYLDDPEKLEKEWSKWKALRMFTPLAVPLAFCINRNFDKATVHFSMALVGYVMAIVLFSAVAKSFSLGLVLRSWEKESGKPILIRTPGSLTSRHSKPRTAR